MLTCECGRKIRANRHYTLREQLAIVDKILELSKTMKICDAITSQGIGTASYYRWLNRKLGR